MDILPRTPRRGGRHHLSDNEGKDEADNADVGEDSVSNHSDDVNDANEEDNSDDEEDNDYYWANFMQDIPCYDSDGHLIIEWIFRGAKLPIGSKIVVDS